MLVALRRAWLALRARTAAAVVPAMKERKWGRIVTVGSGHGRLPGRRATLGFDYVLANSSALYDFLDTDQGKACCELLQP